MQIASALPLVGDQQAETPLARPVRLWLFLLCAMVFVMVLLGGATRLTDSGLSMVEWQPLSVLPPLNEAAWMEMFSRYQDTPQFRHHNAFMDLEGFKGIFWLEYIHRLWGRFIGAMVLLPLIAFAIKGWIPRWLGWRMTGLFILGGLQGALGWYMVASGLIKDPMVSPYRLAAHLGMAVLLYGVLWITALQASGLWVHRAARRTTLVRWGMAYCGLVFVTMISGAFVAGHDAGLIYNTFPLMNGQWIPDDWVQTTPWWRNFFDSIAAVQFNHRVIALSTAICGLIFAYVQGRKSTGHRWHSTLVVGLATIVCLQVLLGISTLLMMVPVGLAVAHQGGALILWSVALALGTRTWPDRAEVPLIHARR